MSKIRISAVSYTNTKPFVYGLQHSPIIDQIELSLDNPADCAAKLINNQCDIGLVPVASLLSLPSYTIISDFCIGADGEVNSVFIFSKKPIDQVATLRLDSQSKTSNALAKVLLKKHWKQSPIFVEDGPADAFVQIGDRTFGQKTQHDFVYDLAQEWKNLTGMPFTFAVWASNKKIPDDFIFHFNSALEFGLQNIENVITELPQVRGFDLSDYLTNKLDFNYDKLKQESLKLFVVYLKDLSHN